MRWSLLAFALALVVAGCTQSPPSGASAQDGERQAEAAANDAPGRTSVGNDTAELGETPQVFRQAFDLFVNPDTEVIGIGGTTQNSVFFWDTGGTNLRILNGTASLTWSASPNTPAFRILSTNTNKDAASPYGGSPVTWAIPALTPASPPGWGIGFCADYTVLDGTVPVAQPMRLDLEFSYLGSLPDPSLGGCSGGGP